MPSVGRFPYPNASDVPDGPGAFLAVANAAETAPTCVLTDSTAQALATVASAHTWNTEISDVQGMHAAGSSTVVAPLAGLYRVAYSVTGATNSGTVDIFAYVAVNGVGLTRSRVGLIGAIQYPTPAWSGLVALAVGDLVTLMKSTTYACLLYTSPSPRDS